MSGSYTASKRTTSPKPMAHNLKYKDDYIGMKYGNLTVVAYPADESGARLGGCICRCDCGNEVVLLSMSNLFKGYIKYCPKCRNEKLIQRAKQYAKHHRSKYTEGNDDYIGERLLNVWRSMLERCENPNNKSSYSYYGAKGVSVCNEWHEYRVFREWAYTHGYDENAPKTACTLDRINPYGNYEPSNCRWADAKIQNNNHRKNWDLLSKAEKAEALATAGTRIAG